MATIQIPKNEYPTLVTLATISEEAYDDFLHAVEMVEPTLLQPELARTIGGHAKFVSPDQVANIIGTICALYDLRYAHNITAEKLAELVCDAASHFEAQEDVKQLAAPDIERLKGRLQRLLVFDQTVGVTAKALDVMTEHERTFCGVRLLTDVRPIFTESLETPAAAIVVHQMKLAYHQSDEHKEFFIALDNDDIQELKSTIERACAKARTLESWIVKSGTRHLREHQKPC